MLATFYGCSANILDDEPLLHDLVRRAATATGATVLHTIVHHFEPHGVTALALLAESHASLHTYPERGVAFWDCFTCGDNCDPAASIYPLMQTLNPSDVESEIVVRRAA